MSNPVLDVQIETHAYGGECLARAADGRRVFVRDALPGERVRVRVTEDRPSYLRAHTVEVLRPCEWRVTPRCAHYGECGGCHLQHMHYAAQLAAKSDGLREQLRRLGGLEAPPRAGIDREALAGLVRLALRRIVYVSCDPSTLARDARALQAAGYNLAALIPIDLFPQTYHIESISLWRTT